MALDDRHPEYIAMVGDWIQMRDCYIGQRAVKEKRLDYLPATEAMIQDGMTTPQSPGWKDYEAYLTRAIYHDVVKDAVKAMVGILHMKPAVIKLPPRLSGMVDKATIQGEGLQMLLRRINEAQLVFGRCGLLVDVPTGLDADKATPYISFYEPERIINWDAGRRDEGRNQLELVVLDESGLQREGFTWVTERKHRVLARGIPSSLESGWTRPQNGDKFAVCVKVNDMSMPTPEDFILPQIAGRFMDDIPFVFVGADDLVPEPDKPPLLGLSDVALAIYRGEADYRQTLFMQGQSTLVIIGRAADDEDKQLRVGAKGCISLRIGGDAKYIGVLATGLGEMRQSLKSDCDTAAAFGVQFMDVGNARGESGEALRIRVAARTTTISSIAHAAGSALEQALKYCAMWVGEDPNDVSVSPQTDFADQNVAGASLLAFMQAKQLGLPLSLKSMHRMMQLNDMTEMDFDQENEQIEAEAESLIGNMVMGAAFGVTDDTFLDTGAGGGTDPVPAGGGTTSGNGLQKQAATKKPPKNVPIKPHRRGSPNPLKVKVGKKGDSAKR
jgi:Domain of unknown function (DUF4055)